MRIPLPWLESMLPLPDERELVARLTAAGLECAVEGGSEPPDGVVTGRILSCERHPRADRLSVCRVDVGDGRARSIVCGAPNVEAGRVGACALPGAELGDGLVVGKRTLRGVESEGMLCSEAELGLSDDHSGILFLPDDIPSGTPIGEVLSRPRVLVTEPLSNRGDWMSVLGVAREAAAVLGVPWSPVAPPPPRVDAGGWSVGIEEHADCPRYAGRVVEGLRIAPSPDWLAQRLSAAAVRPISNLVDVTNYVLLEHGHPLHAFDLDKLCGRRIGVRRARNGESLTTLDGTERTLDDTVLVICDESGVVALAGVMGGEPTMVTEATTRVFLEGASFAARRVRAGARSLHMTTDASARFERGVDPEGVAAALDRAVELLLELNPGARLSHAVDAYPSPEEPKVVALRRTTLRRILGTDLPVKEVKRILGGLGMQVETEDEAGWSVRIPTFRGDVTAEEDLVEEVARIHGYDRLPERVRGFAAAPIGDAPGVRLAGRSRRLLLGLGLTETVTPSLIDSSIEGPLVPGPGFFHAPVPLRNPLSRDRDALRGSLVPSLLHVLDVNRSRLRNDLALFEVGRVFSAPASGRPREHLRAAILLSGRGRDGVSAMVGKRCDFFDMKGLLEVYVEGLWGTPLRLEDGASEPLSVDRAATVVVGDQRIGVLGEVGSRLRNVYDLPADLPVIVAELDLEGWTGPEREFVFRSPPRFPGVHRDLAFVVPKRTRHDELASALAKAGGELLAESRLFDVYEGAPLATDEKSLAFMLVFRSPDRSLTHEEVDERVERIVKHLAKEAGARIR